MATTSFLLMCVAGLLARTLPTTHAQACSSTSLSVDEKLALLGTDNDNDNDGIVTYEDVSYDGNNNYDTDKDGSISEAEWIARWTCRYGDSEYYARYVFALLVGGELTVPITSWNVPPFSTDGVPLAAFLSMNRDRYTDFATKNCVDTALTTAAKLDLLVEDNDGDNDGTVTSTDIANDLNNNYDTDSNGNVTKAEWALRWVCRYGDTVGYAEYAWDQIRRGNDVVTAAQFAGAPFNTGLTVAAFRASNQQRYDDYAALQSSDVTAVRAGALLNVLIASVACLFGRF